VETQIDCVVFVRILADEPIVSFVRRLIDAVRSTSQDIRFVQRVIPLEFICTADLSEVETKCKPLLDSHFQDAQVPRKFAILFKARNTQKLSKEETICRIATMVTAPHTVDLDAPEKVIVIETFRNVVGVGVVDDYYTLKRYNLAEISVQSRVNSMLKE
jgi:tRNA acetyltransferase TAN1